MRNCKFPTILKIVSFYAWSASSELVLRFVTNIINIEDPCTPLKSFSRHTRIFVGIFCVPASLYSKCLFHHAFCSCWSVKMLDLSLCVWRLWSYCVWPAHHSLKQIFESLFVLLVKIGINYWIAQTVKIRKYIYYCVRYTTSIINMIAQTPVTDINKTWIVVKKHYRNKVRTPTKCKHSHDSYQHFDSLDVLKKSASTGIANLT